MKIKQFKVTVAIPDTAFEWTAVDIHSALFGDTSECAYEVKEITNTEKKEDNNGNDND